MSEPSEKTSPRFKIKMPHIAMGTVLGGGSIWSFLDPETVKSLLVNASSHQLLHMSVAFTIAAYLHRNWVKEDVSSIRSDLKEELGKIADAANNLADGVLKIGTRLENLEHSVKNLDDRVERLEFPTRGVKSHGLDN